MDLQAYYRKVREVEAVLPRPDVFIVSLATPDGAEPGVVSRVPTAIAVRTIVEGGARQATPEEALWGIVQQAVQEYLRQDTSRRELAYKAELEQKRRRCAELERRVNELVEENRRIRLEQEEKT